MAGIGFELKKIAGRGGLLAYSQVIFSGILIVAGPWIISIINITLAQRFLETSAGSTGFLVRILVYSYAVSLIVFGGFHHPFTRLMSDLIYKKRENRALVYTWKFSLLIGISSFLLAFLLTGFLPFEGTGIIWLRLSISFFFFTINVLWIVMLFASVLKWFFQIILSYLSGALLTQLFLFFGSSQKEPGLVILGFALGNLTIIVLLLLFSFRSFPGGNGKGRLSLLGGYFVRYKTLFFVGLLYNAGIWMDKILYWSFRGDSSLLPLYPPYDSAVYLASLASIPGLIFFVVVSETDFYILLKKFLLGLKSSPYREIQQKKYRLIRKTKEDFLSLALLQGIITLSLILLSPRFVPRFIPSSSPLIFSITLTAGYFLLLFLSLLNFHFYLETYTRAFQSALIFFLTNFLISLFSIRFPVIPPGTGYAAAGFLALLFCRRTLFQQIRFLERDIFLKAGRHPESRTQNIKKNR